MRTISIDDKLGKTKFKVNEESHIEVDREYLDKHEMERLCKACPAGLYKIDEKGELRFSHLGCLECGTCKVLSDGRVVTAWNYPDGGFGVNFRHA